MSIDFGVFGQYGELVFAVVGVFAAIAALLPAPSAQSGRWYRALYRVSNWLAINIAHARNASDPAATEAAEQGK